MGGLAWFLAVAGFTEMRGWNRISTLVAFLALAWLVLSVDRLLASSRLAQIGRWPIAAGALVLVLVGIADQTSSAIVPDRRDVATEFAADREYFAQLEEQLPRGAAVFQLPYMPYPETPAIENMIVYDPLRPYLHTNELKWSYGGMKGRESDWQAVTGSKPTSEIVDDAIAAGFSAVPRRPLRLRGQGRADRDRARQPHRRRRHGERRRSMDLFRPVGAARTVRDLDHASAA